MYQLWENIQCSLRVLWKAASLAKTVRFFPKVAQMHQGTIIDLDASIALNAKEIEAAVICVWRFTESANPEISFEGQDCNKAR